jgi:hypothetical protein
MMVSVQSRPPGRGNAGQTWALVSGTSNLRDRCALHLKGGCRDGRVVGSGWLFAYVARGCTNTRCSNHRTSRWWLRSAPVKVMHTEAESHVSNLERKIRGSAVRSAAGYVENCEAKLQARIWQSIPAELVQPIKDAKPGEFYPLEYYLVVSRAVASTVPDPTEAYQTLVGMGKYIANDAINSFLRLLVKFLKPSLFARKFHEFFRKDHNFGKLEADLSEIENNRFVVLMSEVGGYDNVAPLSIGWIAHTLDAMGCKDVVVSETLSPPPGPQNAERYRFEVSWN